MTGSAQVKPKPSTRIHARSSAASPKSLWWPSLRNVFLSLNEIPLTALTAFSAVLGMGILLRYFELIGFTPDVGTLVGLSVSAALAMLLFLLVILLSLQAPVVLIRVYGLPLLSPRETFSAQIVVFSMMAVWVGWSQPPASGYLILSFLIVFAIALCVLMSSLGLRLENAGTASLSAAVIGFGSFFIAYALLASLSSPRASGGLSGMALQK